MVKTELADCRREKSVQTTGASSEPPVMAPMLSTTLTSPPTLGTSRASPTVMPPKTTVASRPTRTKWASEAWARNSFL